MKKYINKLELKNGIKVLKKRTSLIVLGTSLLTLSGCGNNIEYTENTTEIVTESTTEATTEMTTEYVEPTTEVTTELTTEITTEVTEATTELTTEETTEMTTEATTDVEVTTETTESTTEEKSKDEIITEFFAEQKEELNGYIDSNDVEKIKSKGKDIFTTFVDFIFYDGEIYGIKYDELSEGIKEQLYTDFCNIDTLVSSYSPDYKEDLADKYYKVKDYVSPKYYSIKNKIVETLGNDNMERLDAIKENASEVGEDLYNRGKEKLKEKYENWRDE